jgi:hypothetical protein
MRFIGRLFVILFAFVIACVAAGIIIAFGVLGSEWPVADPDPVARATFWVATAIGTSFTGAASFLPLLLVVILAEAFRLRSVVFYALAGVVIVLVAYYGSGIGNPYEESIDHPGPITRGVEIAIASGAAFGLVYWLIAGRKAGAWRDPRGA